MHRYGFHTILIILLAVITLGQDTPVFAAPAQNNTLYVIDHLQIGVRRGPSMEHATIETIQTGASVTYLSESQDKLWVKVVTPSGKEGWMMRRYLMDSPPAALLLKNTSVEGDLDLSAIIENLRIENQENKSKLEESARQLRTTESRLERLTQDCSSSISLRESHDSLQDQLTEQAALIKELQAENESLGFTSNLRWFLAGGCVLLVGWFMGWLFGKRKRGSGYSGRFNY